MRTRFTQATVVIVAIAALVARAGAERVKVEVPVFEGGEGMDFFVQCAREYEKLRPDIEIDLYGDPRIADKVRIRILEGTFPEATNAQINYWPLIRNGYV